MKKSQPFIIKTPRVIARGVFSGLTTAVLLFFAIFGLYQLIRYKAEQDATKDQIASITTATNIAEIQTGYTYDYSIPDSDPYWKLLSNSLINADLSAARTENPEVVGWLELPGTEINYPYVKTSDNDFHINHSLNRAWNSAGWPFLDFRNSSDFSDQNSIIYAHGRSDGTMFGTLKNVLGADWQNTTENHVVKTSTDASSSLWQVFSVYEIPTTTDYLTTSFSSTEEFQNFLNLIKNRSIYDFHTSVTPSDKVLTLSTCGSATTRIVLHAKLIQNLTK